jgi:hypothetical protein
MRKLQEARGLDQLIEAGSAGFFPLFYPAWIQESFADAQDIRKMSFSRASETVHRIYRQIEAHQSLERKKSAIQALQSAERKDFIVSFMKMVEYRTLDRLRELH